MLNVVDIQYFTDFVIKICFLFVCVGGGGGGGEKICITGTMG